MLIHNFRQGQENFGTIFFIFQEANIKATSLLSKRNMLFYLRPCRALLSKSQWYQLWPLSLGRLGGSYNSFVSNEQLFLFPFFFPLFPNNGASVLNDIILPMAMGCLLKPF